MMQPGAADWISEATIVSTLAFTFVLRLAVVRYGWRSYRLGAN